MKTQLVEDGGSAIVIAPDTGNARKISLVVGAGIGMAGGFASLYFSTLSIFLKPIATMFGWGRGQLSAVALLAMIGSALAAPVVGKLIDRYGAQRVTGMSVVLFAAGLACLSQLPGSIFALSLLSFSLGALATATTPPGYLSVFPQHFDKRLGAALGCAMIGIGVGAAAAPLLAQALIAAHGWRESYLWLAGLALVFGLLANLLCFAAGPRANSSPVARSVGAAESYEGDDLRTAIRTRRFWLIAVALWLVSASALGAMIHLFSLLTDRGIAPAVAAGAVATVGVAAGLGRFATGILMDSFSARIVTACVFILGGGGLATLALSSAGTSIVVYTVAAAFFGLAIGAEGDIIPFLARRYFGRKAFGTIFGCFFSAYMLGAFAGPIAYGIGFDRLGGYTFPLVAASIACLAATCLVLAIGPYRYGPGHK
ncbi:MAG: MFS transporter [Pseudomonadota bacterium]